MRRVSLRERILLCVGFMLLVFCTFAKASVLSLELTPNDDLIRPAAKRASYSPANSIPEPAGLLTLAFVGIVVAHRSRARWSR